MKPFQTTKLFSLLGIGVFALTAACLAQVRQTPPPASTAKSTHETGTKGIQQEKPHMSPKVTTFLMFDGKAEAAMNLYVSLFENSRIIAIDRYKKEEPGAEGSVKHATFSLDGQELRCIDSYVKHDFTFTPAMSLFVTCKTDPEIATLFAKLSEDGQVLMPLQTYPFAKKFAGLNDRFGVSWQLSLP